MRPIPAPRIGDSHGLLRAIDERERVRLDEFVTDFSVDDLFPPGLENALGRTRQFVSFARAAGLLKEDRGTVELTEIGRRYIRSGDADAPFDVSPGQAEWLRRQLREKHMTDSIYHGLAIGLSLLSSAPGAKIATLDFGRSLAYLGRAGWDNENTLEIQGERHIVLLRDLELIDEARGLTATGTQTKSELTLPVHMSLVDIAGQLNPGGPDAVRTAGEAAAAAEAAPVEPAPPEPAAAEPAVAASEDEYADVGPGAWASAPETAETEAAPPPEPEPPAPPEPPAAPEPVAAEPPPAPEPVAAEPPTSRPEPPPDIWDTAAPDDATRAITAVPPPAPPPEPELAPPEPEPAAAGLTAGDPLAATPGDPADAATVISSAPSAPHEPAPPPEPPAPHEPAAPVAEDPPLVEEPPAPEEAPPPAEPPPLPRLVPREPEPEPEPDLPPAAAALRRTGAFVDAEDLRAAAEAQGLRLPGDVYAAVAAALATGRHVVLVGPPGAGKTALALAVAKAAVDAGKADGATLVSGPDAAALAPLATFLGHLPVTLDDGELAAPAEWRIVGTAAAPPEDATPALLNRLAFVEVPPHDDLEAAIREAAGDETAAAAVVRLLPLRELAPLGAGPFLAAARHAAERRATADADEATLTAEVHAAYLAPLLDGVDEARVQELVGRR